MSTVAVNPSTPVGPAGPAPFATRVRRAEKLLRAREIGIAVAIVIVFGLTYAKNHSFGSALSVQQLLNGAAIIALLAVGETLVIITRNVDLSVGSVLGLSAYLVGELFVRHPHTPVILGFALGIGLRSKEWGDGREVCSFTAVLGEISIVGGRFIGDGFSRSFQTF